MIIKIIDRLTNKKVYENKLVVSISDIEHSAVDNISTIYYVAEGIPEDCPQQLCFNPFVDKVEIE